MRNASAMSVLAMYAVTITVVELHRVQNQCTHAVIKTGDAGSLVPACVRACTGSGCMVSRMSKYLSVHTNGLTSSTVRNASAPGSGQTVALTICEFP